MPSKAVRLDVRPPAVPSSLAGWSLYTLNGGPDAALMAAGPSEAEIETWFFGLTGHQNLLLLEVMTRCWRGGWWPVLIDTRTRPAIYDFGLGGRTSMALKIGASRSEIKSDPVAIF